jgi:hypothetical protein
MPAFKRFGPADQIDNVLVLEPKYDLVSGSNGWRGSPEGVGSSLNLYGGSRRRTGGVVKQIEYQSHNPIARQIGNPVRSFPLTSSINVVWMTNEPLSISEQSPVRWGEEHWDVTMRLYQDYSWRDPDYITGSYDYYCLYFHSGSQNISVGAAISDGLSGLPPTGSFTLEAWVKPFSTASADSDFTIQAMNHAFWFGLTGSTGRLALSSSAGIVTASMGLNIDRWNHAAVTFNTASLTGTFYVNLHHAGQFTLPTAITSSLRRKLWTVGNQGHNISSDTEAVLLTSGSRNRSFHGLVGENRYWGTDRTWAQISGAYNRRLSGSELSSPTLVGYMSMFEGPLSRLSDTGFAMGSGTVDLARLSQNAVSRVGALVKFNDRPGPVWLPSDNVAFRPNKALAPSLLSGTYTVGSPFPSRRADDVTRMVVIDVPSAFYGRQIAPNSVRIVDNSWSGPTYKMVRVLVDDGRGGLYISGSMVSSSITDREEYAGVGWNKVGNVFYNEGLIAIKDPALLDFGRTDGSSAHPADTLQLSFRGTSMVPVKTLMCRIDRGEFNCSANPTFMEVEDDGVRSRSQASGSLRITTVGVYNSDHELVGVARLADPLRVRDRDRMNIKLRLDF